MTLFEMKKKVLGLIEEVNPNNENLTDDPDISMKITRYVELEVSEGELIDYEQIAKECGSEVYQINLVEGVDYEFKAQGTIIKVLESGTMGVDFFIYPERITEKTNAKGYEFELSQDALEIMPYGVAGILLKSDRSMDYGRMYSEEYEAKKRELDPRYNMGSITIEGGVNI